MSIAHVNRFETDQPDHVLTQLRGYKERELDRSPPKGLRAARILRGIDGRRVSLYTEWDNAQALEDVRDSAPWEACMDLAEVHADQHREETYQIEE